MDGVDADFDQMLESAIEGATEEKPELFVEVAHVIGQLFAEPGTGVKTVRIGFARNSQRVAVFASRATTTAEQFMGGALRALEEFTIAFDLAQAQQAERAELVNRLRRRLHRRVLELLEQGEQTQSELADAVEHLVRARTSGQTARRSLASRLSRAIRELQEESLIERVSSKPDDRSLDRRQNVWRLTPLGIAWAPRITTELKSGADRIQTAWNLLKREFPNLSSAHFHSTIQWFAAMQQVKVVGPAAVGPDAVRKIELAEESLAQFSGS